MNNHEIHEKGQFLVYEAEDGQIKIDVRLEDETVWLTQRLMAELFQKDVRTINHHIQSIYEEGELEPTPTIRKYRIVQTEGKRQVSREKHRGQEKHRGHVFILDIYQKMSY